MTLRQFVLLTERHKEHVKLDDHRAGEIIAILYNANRDSDVDPKGIDWTDVFPVWKEPTRAQTEEEMMQVMLAFKASTEGLPH